MDYRTEAPDIIKGFLTYHETIKGHSRKTVDEYYLDLRNFFRFLKIQRGIVPRSTELEDISISDIDLNFVKSVTVTEAYEYLSFMTRDKVKTSAVVRLSTVPKPPPVHARFQRSEAFINT